MEEFPFGFEWWTFSLSSTSLDLEPRKNILIVQSKQILVHLILNSLNERFIIIRLYEIGGNLALSNSFG